MKGKGRDRYGNKGNKNISCKGKNDTKCKKKQKWQGVKQKFSEKYILQIE